MSLLRRYLLDKNQCPKFSHFQHCPIFDPILILKDDLPHANPIALQLVRAANDGQVL